MTKMFESIQLQIRRCEEKLLLIEERESQYVLSTKIPLDLIKEKNELNKRIEELKFKLISLQENSSTEDIADQLTIEQNIKNIHVNRDEEMKLFLEAIEGRSKIHIFFIEAESGMGKSALIGQFLEMIKDLQLPHSKVDFRNTGYTFGEIFGEMCFQFGEDCFSVFRNHCQNFIAHHGQTVAHIATLMSSIDATMAKLDHHQRKIERQIIIDAFFADLSTLHNSFQCPIVILFDTFEKASGVVKEWMTGQFIIRIKRYPWIICVVSGQQTPTIDLDANWCLHNRLEHLHDKDVREYLQRVQLVQSEELIKFITLHSKGHPATLQQLALTLSTMER